MVITPKEDPTPNASILVSCTATTFVLVEQPPAAPAAPDKKKGTPAKKAAPAKKTE